MAPSTGGGLEIKLQIRYVGLKATQYFSKFTPESDATFRADLTSLRLPHPKRENTTFVSHGCVQCVWPAVQKDGTLHKHIALKSKPSEELLQSLSISNLNVKYIYPQKRKLPEEYAESYPSKSASSQSVNRSSSGLPFPFKKHNTTWERPHKLFKIDPTDDPSRSPEPEQPFPTFKNLPPLPPRKAPERIHVPTSSNSKGSRTFDISHQTQNAEHKPEEDSNLRPQLTGQSLRPNAKGNEPPTSSSVHGQKPSTSGKLFPNSLGSQTLPNSSQTSTAKPTAPISKPFNFNFKPSKQDNQVSILLPGVQTDTTKFPFKASSASTGQIGASIGASFRTNISGTHLSEKTNGRRNDGTFSSVFGGQSAFTSRNEASSSFPDIFGSQKPPDGTQKDSSQSTSHGHGIFNFEALRNVATSSQSQASIAGLNKPSSGIAFVQTVFPNPIDTKRSVVITDDVKMDLVTAHNASKAPPVAPKAYYDQINAEDAGTSPAWYKPQPASRLPTGPKVVRGDYTKPDQTPDSPPVKQECTEDSSLLHNLHAPNLSVTPTNGLKQTRTRPSRFQPAESPSKEKDAPQVKNQGSHIVQEFLSSLKSKESARARVYQTSNSSSAVEALPKAEAPEPQIPLSSSSQPPLQAQPPSSVAQDQYERGSMQQLQWDWYESPEVPPFRGPAPQVDTTMGSVLPTPPSSAADSASTALAALNTLKSASWYHNPDQQQQHQAAPVEPPSSSDLPTPSDSTWPLVPSLSSSSSQNQPISLSLSSSTSLSMGHKRKRTSTHTKDELLAIQNLLREASDIKREIAAKMAREAVVIAELKSLNSSVVPRHIKLGHQTEEDMEAEIFRLRNELKREKRLREEAENAIKDIRRECKEPFVVPSLLDAFVQVSKLTTRGLRLPEPSQMDAKDERTDTNVSVAQLR